MPQESSEEGLKNLERSNEDVNALLDHAISIAGLKYNEALNDGFETKRGGLDGTSSFREQWLLRWAVKNLQSAIQTVQRDNSDQVHRQFVTNRKTWSFLLHLLSVIPEAKSIEILIERKFTKLLTEANNLILESQVNLPANHFHTTNDDDDIERPPKRLRLSPVPNGNSSVNTEATREYFVALLIQFVKVTDLWAELLQPKSPIQLSSSRSVTPAWVDSVKEAALFVVCILTTVRKLMSFWPGIDQGDLAAGVTSRWLQLWHSYASSNNSTDRKTIDKTFNEVCLNSCLELYALGRHDDGKSLTAIRKEVEKYIALYTILPLRSLFASKHAKPWQTVKGVLSWDDIEPVLTTFHDRLGKALSTKTVIGKNINSLEDPRFASFLVEIASRLVPSDDVRRKQLETPWLEALVLCMVYLGYAENVPKMRKDVDGIWQRIDDNMPPTIEKSLTWPHTLLETIATEGLQLSESAKSYLVASIISWKIRPLPLPLLSKIVNLDPSIFVPRPGEANSTACRDSLLDALAEGKLQNVSEYNLVVYGIVIPLFDAFAKARNFEQLLELWQPNLEDALRVRISRNSQVEGAPCTLAWDDEEVFTKFTALCRNHILPGFAQKLLSETVEEIEKLPQRVGTTLDVFARLAVLESIVKAKQIDLATLDTFSSGLISLAGFLPGVIQQQNDYQGQRWRLWSIVVTLHQAGVLFAPSKDLLTIIEASFKQFRSKQLKVVDNMQLNQRSSLLLEQYHMFSLVVQWRFSSTGDEKAEGNEVHELLDKQVKAFAKIITDNDDSRSGQELVRGKLWDGRFDGLLGVKEFTDGVLGRLIQGLSVLTRQDEALVKTLNRLTPALQAGASNPTPIRSKEDFLELAVSYLARSGNEGSTGTDPKTINGHPENRLSERGFPPKSTMPHLRQGDLLQIAMDVRTSRAHSDGPLTSKPTKATFQGDPQSAYWSSLIRESILVLNTSEADLKENANLAKAFASKVSLRAEGLSLTPPRLVGTLELCMLVLKHQPGVVNQAMIDGLLRDLLTFSSSTTTDGGSHLDITDSSDCNSSAIFDRLVEIVGILLARYRRRLTGRAHLLLPVLQSLLRCFFYTPDKKYIYQNATTSKQRYAFRLSLPRWLKDEPLPTKSAVKFSKIVSSICNPTTASARSAHRRKTKNTPSSIELNDETKKAKRIAAQYMQYLVMEYARCILDGVIQPEVREKLMPGMYSILDAMDRDLMKAMNSAMDQSSRAIFKGLYDDWTKFWKWDQA